MNLESDIFPLLPLRNAVLFPTQHAPIHVARARSVRLIEGLFGQKKPRVLVFTQKQAEIEEPTQEDLFEVGLLAQILKVIRISDKSYSVVLQGISRVKISNIVEHSPYIQAKIVHCETIELDDENVATDLKKQINLALQLNIGLPKDMASVIENIENNSDLIDIITYTLPVEIVPIHIKQQILSEISVRVRFDIISSLLSKYINVFKIKQEVMSSIQEEFLLDRRGYLLKQLNLIQKELGESNETENEFFELMQKVEQAKLPIDVYKVAIRQLNRLKIMSIQSPEHSMVRNYIECLAELPWNTTTQENLNVYKVRQCLDEDHCGLEKIKKRIVEFIAIRKLSANKKSPILCLVGPPGVGKTSLGQSIARAMGRKLYKIALGGVQDEAEIRGHRRTYIGSMPGRIIQGLRKIKSKNPIIQLDEIDKMGSSRGDPSGALLEILDPEQNHSFVDHYLEIPFDLSQVLFFATANQLRSIPAALLDRMDIIEIPGYTYEEKLDIAIRHIIPKQSIDHNIDSELIKLNNEEIIQVIDHYTMEAGVRGLEKQIASLYRWIAMQMAEGKNNIEVNISLISQILGVRKYEKDFAEKKNTVGVSMGLISTVNGGELLFVECNKMPGKGKLLVTGNLKNVMQESVEIAISYIKSNSHTFSIEENIYTNSDLHVHLPQGGLPKEGTYAGLAICFSILSRYLDKPISSEIAMIGEITLKGQILPVDSLKSKVIAANQVGIKKIILPAKNQKDLEEITNGIKLKIEFIFVSTINQVFEYVFSKAII